MKTLVDIPEVQLRRLDARARVAGVSRAELIQQAVDRLLGPADTLSIRDVFGLWGNDVAAGEAYLKQIKSEWDREWDPD